MYVDPNDQYKNIENGIFSIRCYFTYTLVPIIILSNIWNLIVYSRKPFKNQSITFYLKTISILDFFQIYPLISIFVFEDGSSYKNIFKTWIKPAKLCTFNIYFMSTLELLPGWFVALIAVDRAIQTRWLKTRTLLNRFKFNMSLVFCLLLALSLINIYRLPENLYDTYNYLGCLDYYVYGLDAVKGDERLNQSIWISIVFLVTLPFILMVTANAVTIKTLCLSKKKFKTASNSKRNKKERTFAILSFSMNVYYLIFYLPFNLLNIFSTRPNLYGYAAKDGTPMFSSGIKFYLFFFSYFLSKIFWGFYVSFQFLTYCISNRLYRRESRKIFFQFKKMHF